MPNEKERDIYKILLYMSEYARYPKGESVSHLRSMFDKDILDELKHYDYIELIDNGENARITVKGREALKTHVLTLVSVAISLVALLIAVLSLLLKQEM